MSSSIRVLIVEDSEDEAVLAARELKRAGFQATYERVDTGKDLCAALKASQWDVLLVDYTLPHFSGVEALALIKQNGQDIPVIIVSATIGEEKAVEAMRAGAHDYVMKDRLARLGPAVERELREASVRRQRQIAEQALAVEQERFRALVEKSSDAMAILSVEGAFLYRSPSTERIMGYSSGDLAKRTVFELIHAEDLPEVKNVIEQIQHARGESMPCLARFRHKNGSWRWIEAVATNLLHESSVGGIVLNYRDVTSRKLAEVAVRESETRYRQLFENARMGILLMDAQTGQITDANPLAVQMLGYSCKELLQRKFWEAGLFEDPEKCKFAYALLQAKGSIQYENVPIRRKDGQHADAELAASILRICGTPVAQASIRDITRQRCAEAALQHSLSLLQATLDSTVDGILVVDNQKRIVSHNQTFSNMWQMPREILASGSGNEVFAFMKGLIKEQNDLSANELATDVDAGTEDVIELSDGRTFECHSRPHRLQSKIVGRVWNFRDITEQKSSEQALRRSEERFRFAARAAHEAIWERDLASDRMWWSETFYTLFQHSPALAKEDFKWWIERLHPADRKNVVASLEKALGQCSPLWQGEYRFCRGDGTYADIVDRAFVILDEKKNPVRMIGSMMDVTEKRALEAQFLRSQRLEAVGTLASGVAHDLNNVLAPIRMAAEILKMKELRPDDLKMVQAIETSAARGAEIVKQVLTFARGVPGERCPIQLRHTLADIKEVARQTFPPNIRVSVDAAGDLWPVQGNVTQLHQVLLNLALNARDAMPSGGTLELSAQNVIIEESGMGVAPEGSAGPFVQIQVADTGAGIPGEIMDEIFVPFFTTKPPGKGTGLGLSSAIGIVKSHGGFIQVRSEVGRGSVFEVYLPAAPTEQPEPVEKGEVQPQGAGELILVVDDEPTIAEVTRNILASHGYRVATASDGTEAIALFMQQSVKVDLVLTDILMPFMDGVSLVRTLRRIDPKLKIAVSSGVVQGPEHQDKMAALREMGVKTFLLKPYNTERLLTALYDILHPAGH